MGKKSRHRNLWVKYKRGPKTEEMHRAITTGAIVNYHGYKTTFNDSGVGIESFQPASLPSDPSEVLKAQKKEEKKERRKEHYENQEKNKKKKECATALRSRDRPKFPFFKLPGELRNKVYEYCLAHDNMIYLTTELGPKMSPSGMCQMVATGFELKGWRGTNILQSTIFHIGSDIREEAYGVFYLLNNFTVEEHNAALFFEFIGKVGMNSLQRLAIKEFKCRMTGWHNSAPYLESLKACPRLKHLYLNGDLAYWNEERKMDLSPSEFDADALFRRFAPEAMELRSLRALSITAIGKWRESGKKCNDFHRLRYERGDEKQLILQCSEIATSDDPRKVVRKDLGLLCV